MPAPPTTLLLFRPNYFIFLYGTRIQFQLLQSFEPDVTRKLRCCYYSSTFVIIAQEFYHFYERLALSALKSGERQFFALGQANPDVNVRAKNFGSFIFSPGFAKN